MPNNSARLNYIVNEAHKLDNAPMALDAFKQYQIAHCYHPQLIKSYDAHTGTYKKMYAACGRCYHCRESHINEWVTRCYAHCEDYKYVYFITLTYRSFSGVLSDLELLMLKKLNSALWHRDSFNETKRFCYSPCVLVKSHYQNFIKRLRKYTGISNLSYIVCGETGKNYGRPHFHFILFSNDPISRDDIKRSWSIALFKHDSLGWQFKTNQKNNGKTYYFPIGRIDYNDLVSNGSFNTGVKIKVDGQYLSSGRCFAYVCKYVCKGNDFNRKRVQLAYNSIYHKQLFTRIYENDLSLDIARSWCLNHGITNQTNIDELIKKFTYEKVIKDPKNTIFLDGVSFQKVFNFGTASVVKDLYPDNYFDFIESFEPFVEFSRGTAIGSIYAKTHIKEFAEGVFNKPLLQTSSFVVPSYFRSKVKDFLYGLRKVRSGFKGTSYSYGNLPNLRGLFYSMRETISARYLVACDTPTEENISKLVKSPVAFFDSYNKEHIIFPSVNGVVRADSYKYDRSSKKYILVRSMPLISFIDYWLDKLECEFVRYKSISDRSKDSLRLEDSAFCIMTDLGLDLSICRKIFEDDQNNYLHRKNAEYDEVHVSAE